MFRLDYLSCFLTILATILVARKSWTGLVVSSINCLVVCVIGLRTSQLGFIPANLFCICMYVFSIRSWLRDKHNHGEAGNLRSMQADSLSTVTLEGDFCLRARPGAQKEGIQRLNATRGYPVRY